MMAAKPVLLAMTVFSVCGPMEAHSQSIDMPPTAPDAVELLAGRYAYIGNSDEDHQTIQKSIDAAISNLGWLGRKIAGNRLANHKELPTRIEISQSRDDISIVMGSYEAVAPVDGTKRALVGPNGRDAKLHYELEADAIVQYFVFEQATRKSTYSFDPAGNLVMTVYMTSEKLARPIEYALVYAPGDGE